MKNYTVELNFYHGTSESDFEKIDLLGAEELFFTSCLGRAKQYSVDGVVLQINKKFKFKYLNEARKFCREIIKTPYFDIIEKNVKPKKYKVKRFKVGSKSGKEERFYIISNKNDLWWYAKPSPAFLEKTKDYKKIHSKKDINLRNEKP